MKNALPLLFVLGLCLSALSMSSCTAVGFATGAAATAGVAAASEGGIGGAASDFKIQFQINELWFSYDIETFRKLDLTINQGRVLITGIVQNPENRVEAVRLAWQPKGVKQVINEIRVAESAGIMGFAKDAWIATRLRTSITLDRDVLSINYSIDVVQGTVYLMGVAQNQRELNRVVETARTISGVKQVISYVKIIGEDIPGQEIPQDGPPAEPPQWESDRSDYSQPDNAQPDYSRPENYQPEPYEPVTWDGSARDNSVQSERLLDAP